MLCQGGHLTPDLVLEAYRSGIFPWPHDGYPLLWFAPPLRAILRFDELYLNARLKRDLRKQNFRISFNEAFSQVIESCAGGRWVDGEYEEGTWITPAMIESYSVLQARGWVHSVEAWQGGELVGGLYGVLIGAHFCGESMFHHVPNASKACVAALVERLQSKGASWLDIETMTPHFERMGATEIPRAQFMDWMRKAQSEPRAW